MVFHGGRGGIGVTSLNRLKDATMRLERPFRPSRLPERLEPRLQNHLADKDHQLFQDTRMSRSGDGLVEQFVTVFPAASLCNLTLHNAQRRFDVVEIFIGPAFCS